MKTAIVIASVARPLKAGRWVEYCRQQTFAPSEMIFSIARASDLPDNFAKSSAKVLIGRGGLTIKRNAGMASVSSDPDTVAFFDDDYVPSRFCLEEIVKAFADRDTLLAASGTLLADGINFAGISCDTARTLVDDYNRDHKWPAASYSPLDGAYGCNMAYQASAIASAQFDERLPLYGWQEDIDISRPVAKPEQMATTNLFVGVHRRTKGGRTSGRKLGYSQIANIVYLINKRTMPKLKGLPLLIRNMFANNGKAFTPEPWVDQGRVVCNWHAIKDWLVGVVNTERILDM